MIRPFQARALILAALVAVSPAPSLAQATNGNADNSVIRNTDSVTTVGNGSATTSDTVTNETVVPVATQPEREDHDFPWGLLGLLGLAGLLGRKRRDDDIVRVDRPTTTDTTNDRL